MRHLLSLLLWLFAVAPAVAVTPFQSQDEFGKWLTFYYQNPEPSRVPEAINYMSKSGLLDNKGAYPPISGFLSGAFRDNPDKMASWLGQLGSLDERHLGVVVLGVWYAGLPQSQKTAYALLEKHAKLKAEYAYLYKGSPAPIEEIPLEQGPWVLDALWGKFMATGDSAPVKRIATTLPWIDGKGDVTRLLTGGAARWSLTSNAVQHKRVLDICESIAAADNDEAAVKLRKIIEDAKKQLQDQAAPAK